MNKIFSIAAIACLLSLASCSVTRPYAVTNNAIGPKKGESSTVALFSFQPASIYAGYSATGLILNKNYGIQEAAKNGKMTRVGAVDLKITNYILFKKFTLVVSGE